MLKPPPNEFEGATRRRVCGRQMSTSAPENILQREDYPADIDCFWRLIGRKLRAVYDKRILFRTRRSGSESALGGGETRHNWEDDTHKESKTDLSVKLTCQAPVV